MNKPRQLLVDKYRPKSINAGYVFQDPVTEHVVRKWVEDGVIPHLMLTGVQGSGKSTLARCLINDTGVDEFDVKKINGSMLNGIGFVREELEPWIKKSGFGKYKVVVIEEAERLSKHHAQKALLDLIESSSDRVRFILTANYPKQLIPALHSRCQHIDMGVINMDGIINMVLDIIESEHIECDDENVLLAHINMYAPDIRKIINSIDQYTIDGKLHMPSGGAGGAGSEDWENYFSSCEKVTLQGAIKLTEGIDSSNFEHYYETMYNNSKKFPDEANAVIMISQYLDRAYRAANQRLHLDAFLYHTFMEV